MPLLEVGASAPAFSVPDHRGNTVQLSDFAGVYFKQFAKAVHVDTTILNCHPPPCGKRIFRDRYCGNDLSIRGATDPADFLELASGIQ